MNESIADALVSELRFYCGLDDFDARRAAFCALAYNRGWSGARIARYLGVSRARADERIEVMYQYAGLPPRTPGGQKKRGKTSLRYNFNVPELRKVLESAQPSQHGELSVSFEIEDWRDEEFSTGMLEMLAAEMNGALE